MCFYTTFYKNNILNVKKNVLTQETILGTIHNSLWHVDIMINVIWISTNRKGDISLWCICKPLCKWQIPADILKAYYKEK